MNKHAIYHITDIPYAYGIDEKTLLIRIRTAKGDIARAIIYYKDRYDWENPFKTKIMAVTESDELFDYYEAEISVEEGRYRYYFGLQDVKNERTFLTERGMFTELREPKEQGAFQFAYLNSIDVYESPDWAQEGIVYQIFPDRFNNGDKTNDPENTFGWEEPVTTTSLFGGDLQGIIDKLDYLKELGVNLIYLTPIFSSSTNHKYNTRDYYSIDSAFGNIDKAKELVNKCHDRGMRIVFDAVFNHSGDDFFAFEDVVKNGEKSRYRDWFYIKEFPVDKDKVNYLTFANNISTMPKFNTNNPEVVQYLLKVAEYWVKEVGIDGWRLDVCDEVDHAFWREFRKTVKKANPEALIIGEIMHEASSWLRGDQLDSIMNYPFKHLSIDFFAKRVINAEEFDSGLTDNRVIYMKKINSNMFNLIDSHDTARFLTEAEGRIERLKLAAAFQFTYIGMPYIYYGDEVGMTGGNDPDCRRCMIWDEEKQNRDLFDFYKTLSKIRKENKALIYGDFKTLYKDKNVIVFKRSIQGEQIIIILNNSDEHHSLKLDEVNGKYEQLLDVNNIIICENRINLIPNDVKILKVLI
ncbi:alpha-glycosidase [Clostridium swellfunianum]|uniref:glycoside hydrolase family 13 protein n=1 Tax=Clostridium swellfunianum TaxID=1367462 RepID=UPI00202E3C92|nr:glycoside hydrolase family 13 protein [Clostridium swellfunianum]MCM0649496.1 alpha-glycosidase [Clostridium swellfunianum]